KRIEPASSVSVSKSMGPCAKESGSAPHAAAPRPTAEAPDAARRERRDSMDAVLSVRGAPARRGGTTVTAMLVGWIHRRLSAVIACPTVRQVMSRALRGGRVGVFGLCATASLRDLSVMSPSRHLL